MDFSIYPPLWKNKQCYIGILEINQVKDPLIQEELCL